MERIDIIGTRIDNVSFDEAADFAEKRMNEGVSTFVVTPNAEIAYLCRYNEEARKAIESADLTICDGVGVLYASKILGTPLKQKIAGIDLAEEIVRRAAISGKKLFLLGGNLGVAETATDKLKAKYKGLNVAGINDGYFKDDSAVIGKINDSDADILFVFLGAPKQELWVYKNREKLRPKLILGLGGSVDVFAGNVKRAPRIFISLGLEWLYRLIKEPWRFKRMLSLPKFLIAVIIFKLKGKKK